MANTIKTYQDNMLWNLGAESGGPSANEVLLNPSSNPTNLTARVIFEGHEFRVEATGSFGYNASKVSASDVSGSFNTYTVYRDGLIWDSRTSTVGLDLNKILFGNDFDYQQSTLQGNDVFFGSSTAAVNDYVRAEAGNDTFTGYDDESSKGGDYFYGGSGTDTSVYRGKMADYTIAKSTVIWDAIKEDGTRIAGYTVTDKTTGRDGTDKLIDVERLHFSDTNVAFDVGASQNAGQAYRLYKAAFDRTPDKEGLGYWINAFDHGASLSAVANAFIASPEFSAMYGENSSDSKFVTLLYNHVLHRDPDAEGNTYWLNALSHGNSRGAVLASFSESPENLTQTTPLIANGIQYQEWV